MSIFFIKARGVLCRKRVFGGGRHCRSYTAGHTLSEQWTIQKVALSHPRENNQSQSVHRPTVQHLKPDRKKSMSESPVQIFRIWNGVNLHINRMEGNCCQEHLNKNATGFFVRSNQWQWFAGKRGKCAAPEPWKSFVWIPGSSPAAELEQNKNTTASTARVVSCPAKHHLALQCKWDSSLSWPEFLTDLLLHVINHSALG